MIEKLLASYPNLARTLPIYQKYQALSLKELTPGILAEIAKAVGLPAPSNELSAAALVELLKGDDIDKIADVFNDPAIIKKVMDHLKGLNDRQESVTEVVFNFNALSAEDLSI